MATTPPMYTTGISTLSPASTYPDLLVVNNAGQGLNNTPSQVQDGLGNRTNMTISSNYINFDRSVSQFQLDGIALTASAATLNNVSDVANGQYVLLNSNVQLPNSSVLSATNGISLTSGAGNVTIQPDPTSPLGQIQQLVGGPNGILVYENDQPFGTVNLIGDATINITNPDGTTGNPTFTVVPDTSVQRVNVQLNGVFESRKSQLNFIPGPGSGINVVDNPSSNRTDITISGVPGSAFNFVAVAYATTTASLDATYNNGASGVGATLTSNVNAVFETDGQNPSVDDVILIKDQTTSAQNGIYVLTTVGDIASPWVLTRANYFDSSATIKAGDIVVVLHGDIYADTGWVETAKVTVVGTDPINFVEFGITGTVTEVIGTLNQIDVVDGSTTPIISISGNYVGQDSITTLGTIDTGTWNGDVVDVPYGGTGVNSIASYGVLCGGTTDTNPIQNVGTGIAGQVLTSSGPGALPQWMAGGGGASFQFSFHQVSHGLVIGNIIRIDNSGHYVVAQADDAANATSVVGIVVNVIDADNFVYQFGGVINDLVGLTVGDPYFLDPNVAGGYTSTIPTTSGQVVLPLFFALSTTDGLWQPKSALELA